MRPYRIRLRYRLRRLVNRLLGRTIDYREVWP
jgi:hypothetical protein